VLIGACASLFAVRSLLVSAGLGTSALGWRTRGFKRLSRRPVLVPIHTFFYNALRACLVRTEDPDERGTHGRRPEFSRQEDDDPDFIDFAYFRFRNRDALSVSGRAITLNALTVIAVHALLSFFSHCHLRWAKSCFEFCRFYPGTVGPAPAGRGTKGTHRYRKDADPWSRPPIVKKRALTRTNPG